MWTCVMQSILRFALSLLCVGAFLFGPLASASGSFTCLMVYDGDKATCWPTSDSSWECDVQPVYKPMCIGSSTVDGAYPTIPSTPGGGQVLPYVDPAWLYIERIDDFNPSEIGVWVNADSRLDNFQAFCNASPCGTGWGTSVVLVGGISGYGFNASHVAIDVEGCSSAGAGCAAARTRSYVADGSKSASGSLLMVFPELEMGVVAWKSEAFPRSVVAAYKDRSYEVPASPGNSRYTFQKLSSALSYRTTPPATVSRTEEGFWAVRPGFGAPVEQTGEQLMTAEPYMPGWEQENTVTDWVSVALGDFIGQTGYFEARVEWAAVSTSAGVGLGGIVSGDVLSVTVP
jgi:hypothetical protein